MPEFLAPGVFVEEIPAAMVPIEGVSTSTAGFVGYAERGPIEPHLVTGWADYTRRYGGLLEPGPRRYLGWAVRGFFENGGRRAFVALVKPPGSTTARASLALGGATGATGTLTVSAVGPGAWGRKLVLSIARGSRADPHLIPSDHYALRVAYYADGLPTGEPRPAAPSESETFDNLSLDSHSPEFIVARVNAASVLVRLAWDPAGAQLPIATLPLTVALAEGGEDGSPAAAGDYAGTNDAPGAAREERSGLAALAALSEISLVCVPDIDEAVLPGLTAEVVRHCETLRDRFCVLHAPRSPNLADLRPAAESSFGAVYFPWINVPTPGRQGTVAVPPSGHVAGAYARTDAERGVHKAPANEVLRGLGQDATGAVPLATPVTAAEQATLNGRRVNCLRDLRSTRQGVRIWGARTMASDPEWKYVNLRRLFIYVEQSIEQGTRWVAFEPNDPRTWSLVAGAVSDFLVRTWRDGALAGVKPEQAFFVKCDTTTMTQDDLDNGRLVCAIGIAPVKPAEFVIVRIGQWTAEAGRR
jgi:phage tail sheath protein FI